MDINNFLFAFSKFSARRGLPSLIISDNASTFDCASRRLIIQYGPDGPCWRFNTPLAPWVGGAFERLVRSVKNALRKSIGLRCLSRDDLEIALLRIESSINERPLTSPSQPHPEGTLPLRPVDFLRPPGILHETEDSRERLEQLKESQREAVIELWRRWRREYLVNLPHLVSNHFERNQLRKGDLCLIRGESIKQNRLSWPLGKIEECVIGRDGLIRSVMLKTKSVFLKRPIQLLHKLEMSPNINEDLTTLSGGRMKPVLS